MRTHAIVAALVSAAVAAGALAQVVIEPAVRDPVRMARNEPVRAELVLDRTTVAPGETFRAAVLLSLAPGWHVYWKNPGDAGTPTVVRWNLPSNFAAPTAIDWPTPRYFTMPGNIRSIGYDGEVAIVSTFRAPMDWRGAAPLVAEVQWLACKEQCIPGRATLRSTLNVGGAPVPINQEFFSRWETRMPRRVAAPTTGEGPLTVQQVGGTYLVHVRGERAMQEPTVFISFAGERGYSSRVRELGGPEATLELTPPAVAVPGGEPTEVVVVWQGAGGQQQSALITVPAGAAR